MCLVSLSLTTCKLHGTETLSLYARTLGLSSRFDGGGARLTNYENVSELSLLLPLCSLPAFFFYDILFSCLRCIDIPYSLGRLLFILSDFSSWMKYFPMPLDWVHTWQSFLLSVVQSFFIPCYIVSFLEASMCLFVHFCLLNF